MSLNPASGWFACARGHAIAWRADQAVADEKMISGFFWLGGFRSDMTGSKAEALAGLARRSGRACFRFDYSGHGASGGSFSDATISDWLDEAVQAFTQFTQGPRIIVGSSMGGWLSLLLLRRLADAGREVDRVKGLVLLAPAVDMTERLMWGLFSDQQKAELDLHGETRLPSLYASEPYLITKRLIEDGRRHLMLPDPIEVPCPVRILQGDRDPDVPESHARLVFDSIRAPDVTMTVVRNGDHRLSRGQDIRLLLETCQALAERADQATAVSNGSSA